MRYVGLPWWLISKESPAMRERQVQSPGWEDSMEKEMAAHFGTLAWEIPGAEPGGL